MLENHPTAATRILTRRDGATIAYHRLEGATPGVVFIHGLVSDMTGQKALTLEAYCRRTGRAFVRFDCFGHGESSGAFTDGGVGRWADDAVAVLDDLTTGPQIIVGSSMGGWVMLLAALRRPERVAGLVGIAAAADFTEDIIWARLTPDQRRTVLEQGVVEVANDHPGEPPYRISRVLIEDGRSHLLLRSSIDVRCPVRLIQGLEDADVPWQTALAIQDKLMSADVEVTLVKGGGHRLSEPHDLGRLVNVVDGLIAMAR